MRSTVDEVIAELEQDNQALLLGMKSLASERDALVRKLDELSTDKAATSRYLQSVERDLQALVCVGDAIKVASATPGPIATDRLGDAVRDLARERDEALVRIAETV